MLLIFVTRIPELVIEMRVLDDANPIRFRRCAPIISSRGDFKAVFAAVDGLFSLAPRRDTRTYT